MPLAVVQKIAFTAIADQADNSTLRPRLRGLVRGRRAADYADAPLQVTQERGDDRVSGSDADRHGDVSRNGSSGFCGNADSAETTDLGRVLLTRARRRVWLSKKCTLERKVCKSDAGARWATRRAFIMSDPSRRSYLQARLKELIERASSVADANLLRRRKPYPFGFAIRSNGSNFAFILDDTKDGGQAIAEVKTLFLQHDVVCYVLTLAAISDGRQFVLFTAEDESGLLVGQREIIVRPAFPLGPLEIIDSDVAEGPLVSLLPYQGRALRARSDATNSRPY